MKKLAHKPLRDAEDSLVEFELTPINSYLIRAFHLCCYCGVLFEAGRRGRCMGHPFTEDYDTEDDD